MAQGLLRGFYSLAKFSDGYPKQHLTVAAGAPSFVFVLHADHRDSVEARHRAEQYLERRDAVFAAYGGPPSSPLKKTTNLNTPGFACPRPLHPGSCLLGPACLAEFRAPPPPIPPRNHSKLFCSHPYFMLVNTFFRFLLPHPIEQPATALIIFWKLAHGFPQGPPGTWKEEMHASPGAGG